MHRSLLSVPLGILVAVCQGGGHVEAEAPAASAETAAATELQTLVEQLGDRAWEKRQQAEERLVSLGLVAVERLRSVIETTDSEEVRTRATTALRKIERQERSRPTLVTLGLREATVGEAIQALAEAGGVDISLWPPAHRGGQQPAKRVNLTLDRQPFWLAVRALCEQAELTPQKMGTETQITLMKNASGWANKPYHLHEGFLVQASRIQRTHHVDLASPGTVRHNFSIQFSVFVDPRQTIIRGPRMVQIEEAIDDQGNSLIKPQPEHFRASLNAPSYGGAWMWDLQAPLQYQPEIGSRLARLKGTVTFEAEEEREVWEVTDLAETKDATKTIGPLTYRFAGLSKAHRNRYTAKLQVDSPEGFQQGRESILGYQTIYRTVRLLDANGKPYRSSGGGGGGGGGSITYQVHFHARGDDNLGEPERLVWTIPVSVREITVPVEFRDLPVP